MACEFCSGPLLDEVDDICRDFGGARFCPVCSRYLYDIRPKPSVDNLIKRIIDNTSKEFIKDENGKTIILEREPAKKSEPPKEPVGQIRDLTVDLDNINIDREIELLRSRREPSRSEILAKHIQHFLEREEGENEV